MTGRGTGSARRVLVGIDGSAHSATALAWAAADARLRGWNLVAVTACGRDGQQAADGARPAMTTPRERACRQMQERLLSALPAGALPASPRPAAPQPASPQPPVSTLVLPGEPVEVLVRAATAGDVLVVGTRGLGRLRSLLLGSVAQGCAERAPCPVVVVPSPPPEAAASGGVRGPVVAGVDPSPEARAALRFAAGEALLRGADLVPVHAVYPDYTAAEAAAPASLGEDDSLLSPLDSDWAQLDMLVRAELAGLDIGAQPVSVRGDPASVLLSWTRSAALIVVGARGAGRLHEALLGSVSSHLLRHGYCPVTVIPSAAGQAQLGG